MTWGQMVVLCLAVDLGALAVAMAIADAASDIAEAIKRLERKL